MMMKELKPGEIIDNSLTTENIGINVSDCQKEDVGLISLGLPSPMTN